MNGTIKEQILTVILSALLPMGGCLATGCTVTLKGEGEVGFRQQTNWAFYHRAVVDEDKATATSNTEFPSLEEWIKAQSEPEGPPAPTELEPD